jgi:hypothetical protein
MVREYVRVAEIVDPTGRAAPPEVSQRFQGRLFTKHDLERRGVRIAGADAWYLAIGQDWRLTLEPAV